MRCVFNSPRPSQRTRPKRKAFPNEIPFVSFLPLTLPTSSSRTSDGTRNLFSLPPRIAVPTPARLSSAGDPRGEACPAPHSDTRSQPNCRVRGAVCSPCLPSRPDPGPLPRSSNGDADPALLAPAARHTTPTHKTPHTHLRPRRRARQLARDPRREREARARWGNRVGPRRTGVSAAPPRSLTYSMK